jgi:nucleoside-diphosphate-sugar epimerase
MRILVTGATGFIGRPLVGELLQRGHEVRAMVRPAAEVSSLPWAKDAETLVTDLRVAQDLSASLRDVDVVIHLAAALKGSDDDKLLETMVSTERLLDAMGRADVGHMVLASSIVVYDWTVSRLVLSERSPLEPRIWKRDGYTRAKFFQERYTRKIADQADWQLTVLRPGFVWGQGARYPLGPARSLGSWHLVFGNKTVLPLTHITNCVRYMSAAVDDNGAMGETINVIDDYELTSADLVREYLDRSGGSSRCIAVPYVLAEAAVKAINRTAKAVLGKDARLPDMFVPEIFAARYRPVRYDRTHLLSVFASTPTLGLEECLEMTFGQKPDASRQRILSTSGA